MLVKQIIIPRGPPPTRQILKNPTKKARRSVWFENIFFAVINNSCERLIKTKWQSLFRNTILYPNNAISDKNDENNNGTVLIFAFKVFYNIYCKKIISVLNGLMLNYN